MPNPSLQCLMARISLTGSNLERCGEGCGCTRLKVWVGYTARDQEWVLRTMSRIVCSVAFSGSSIKMTASSKRSVIKALRGPARDLTVILEAYSEHGPADQLPVRLALSAARASAVRDFMLSLGYPSHKIKVRNRANRDFESATRAKPVPPSRRVDLVALS